ncbi:MAG: GntR family transcriptional regulator [Chloroflexota bacterium]
MDTVDKQSPIPIYYQLHKIILGRIERGLWPPQTQIPSERELAEQFGVSRMTVRQALSALARDGILSREIGRGTYVAEPRITQRLSRVTGFSSDMRARGKRPGARVLSLAAKLASPYVAERLNVDPGKEIAVIERLRLADDEPMALEVSHVWFPGCVQLLQEDISGSLYELLAQRYGILPTRARQQISAGLSRKRECQMLGIRRRAPVLHLCRLTFDQNDRPFEYVESIYRGDKYIFDAELVSVSQRDTDAS